MTIAAVDPALHEWAPTEPNPAWAPTEWKFAGNQSDLDFERAGKELALVDAVLRASNLHLDPWQRWVLTMSRARNRHTGRLASKTTLVLVPRQVGKSLMSAAWGVLNLLAHKDATPASVVGIAHTMSAAGLVNAAMRRFVGAVPELNAECLSLAESSGIKMRNGAAARVLSQSSRQLNGWPISAALVDEAHLLGRETWSQILIGTTAFRDSGIFVTTTAGSVEESVMLQDLIELGRAGEINFAWWRARDDLQLTDPDLDDELRRVNPAVACGRIPLETIRDNARLTDPLSRRRFAFNNFVSIIDSALPSWIERDEWEALPALPEGAKPTGPVTWAVDSSVDRSVVAISCAWKHTDGTIAVALVDLLTNRPRMDLVHETLLNRVHTFGAYRIVVDSARLSELGETLSDAFSSSVIKKATSTVHYSWPQVFRAEIMNKGITVDHQRLISDNIAALRVKGKKDAAGYRLVTDNDATPPTIGVSLMLAAGGVLTDAAATTIQIY